MPQRPTDILAMILFAHSSSYISAAVISVAVYPGAIALTVTPFAAHSLDKAFVS